MVEQKQVSEASQTINCSGCNKQLKRLKRYYRDGKYFCGKPCWKASLKKESKA